jgi:hypothetical protein
VTSEEVISEKVTKEEESIEEATSEGKEDTTNNEK